MRMVNISVACLLVLSANLMASGGEVIAEIGTNIADDNGALDDAMTFGLKYHHYFTDNFGLQAGYNRISAAEYKWSPTVTETDVDRFYLNALYEPPVALAEIRPYFLLGGGYESVSNKADGEASQAFIDGGLGAKYAISNDIDVLAEAKVIQKVDSKDIDKVATLGVGYKFGDKARTVSHQPMGTSSDVTPFAPLEQGAMLIPATNADLEDSGNLPEVGEAIAFETLPAQEQMQVPQTNTMQPGYYVQVKAFAQNKPNNAFFSDISNSGYNYILHSAAVKGKNVTKVLVGPYASYEAAKAESSKIKTNIAHDAFVYRMQ